MADKRGEWVVRRQQRNVEGVGHGYGCAIQGVGNLAEGWIRKHC